MIAMHRRLLGRVLGLVLLGLLASSALDASASPAEERRVLATEVATSIGVNYLLVALAAPQQSW